MNQKECIKKKIQISEERKQLGEEIDKEYEKYVQGEDENNYARLIILFEQYCHTAVSKILINSNLYTKENIEDVNSLAKIRMIGVLKKIYQKKFAVNEIKGYVMIVYKNAARDYVKNRTDFLYNEMVVDSEEKLKKDKEKANRKKLKETPKNPTEGSVDNEYKKYVYGRLFKVYCIAALDDGKRVERNLALIYARIFAHFSGIASDYVMTAVRVARRLMGRKTVGELFRESEYKLKNSVDESICWNEKFERQLDEERTVHDNRVLLEELIYAEHFTDRNIEKWAASTHEIVIKKAFNLMIDDKEFRELAVDYIERDSAMLKLIRG